VATSCQILKIKYTKFDFGWGYAPDPAAGAQRSPDPLAGFKGPTSKGGRTREEPGGRERERKESEEGAG